MDLSISPVSVPCDAIPEWHSGDTARSLPLDASETESIVFNMQAASNIHKRHQFFNWTQGLLQNLISHEMLLCITAQRANAIVRVETFTTQATTADFSRELGEQDSQCLHKLVDHWRQNQCAAMILDVDDKLLAGSRLAREMTQLKATLLLAHGISGPDGKLASIYLFICQPNRLRPRQTYLAELMVPALHAAWMRLRMDPQADTGSTLPSERSQLTRREQEVLKWIYFGKSNIEIGMILGISPLTVKNHVQEILRRLNVLNRAQAVGKALSLHLISTS